MRLGRPLLTVCSLWLAGALLPACGPSADTVMAEVRGHVRSIAALYARTPPTPDNMPFLQEQIVKYRQKRAPELAALRAKAAKLVHKEGSRNQLAVDAYCRLFDMLHPKRRAARRRQLLRGTVRPADAAKKLGLSNTKACKQALRDGLSGT